jgi:cellulose synthase/poly-beta-1,6-N-acetylglucosamine synthase-like glycosyltransferase
MMNIEIWIPAHNEEKVIVPTLAAIQESLSSSFHFKVGVACNGCTDKTEELSRQQGAQVLSLPAIGKWRTLQKIVEQSTADWIGFVDAGTVWSKDLWRSDIAKWIQDPQVGALTLQYSSPGMGMLEKIYWQIESIFKRFEEKLGGSVTVSGFTMFFRRDLLQEVFSFLQTQFGDVNWLNDDVVLPLTLRFLHPKMQIRILMASRQVAPVRKDIGLGTSANEGGRRLRMMRGNIQWMRKLVPLFFKPAYLSLPRLAILLLLFRKGGKVFWAYILLVCSLIFGWLGPALFMLFVFIAQFLNPTGKKFYLAFRASLLSVPEFFRSDISSGQWS